MGLLSLGEAFRDLNNSGNLSPDERLELIHMAGETSLQGNAAAAALTA